MSPKTQNALALLIIALIFGQWLVTNRWQTKWWQIKKRQKDRISVEDKIYLTILTLIFLILAVILFFADQPPIAP